MGKRKLYYIPMIHIEKELGDLQTVTTQVRESVFGKDQAAVFPKKVEEYWKLVERTLQFKTNLFQADIACKTHVFVDSLPNTEEWLVKFILSDLIDKGFPAYQLIGELQTAGATVHGTEDPKLLVQEREYQQESKNRFLQDEEIDVAKGEELLKERDDVIIKCVHEKVPENEMGIIFIGRLHNVIEPLSKPPYNFELIQL